MIKSEAERIFFDMSNNRKSIKIGDRRVGPESEPFIIAEMSGNHNQSLDKAMELVEAAAGAGAHAVKLQTYTADTMTLPVRSKIFEIGEEMPLWQGKNLHDLYKEAYTPWEWHAPIMERCKSLGMLCFSTPFDESSVDFLNDLQVPCFKIASFENTHIPLLRKIAKLGKPVIMSSGMASIAELDEAVKTLKENGCSDLILLKCTTSYPASPENSNIVTIPHMQELFDVQVGLSDHTMGVGAAVAAVALGATVVEKHFTLRRSDGGPDAAFSLEPAELAALVTETKRAWQSLGVVNYGSSSESEKKAKYYRRSIFFKQALKAGSTVTAECLAIVRPAAGLAPKHYDTVLGKTLTEDVEAGTPLSWKLLKD